MYGGGVSAIVASPGMTRTRRANGAGSVYTKHGSFYGRWTTEGGGHPNRLLGPVRLPGAATGMTRKQAERRLRELMDEVQVTTDVELTVAMAGQALLEQLEAKGRAKSHLQTVESHLRVHVAPFFKEKPIDRVSHSDVTRFLVALRRKDLKPKTARNVLSTLHSLFELALRRRWVSANPCKLVEAPVVEHERRDQVPQTGRVIGRARTWDSRRRLGETRAAAVPHGRDDGAAAG